MKPLSEKERAVRAWERWWWAVEADLDANFGTWWRVFGVKTYDRREGTDSDRSGAFAGSGGSSGV